MWKVVYVASTEQEALKLEEELENEGYLIKIIPGSDSYQIQVPESEADEIYRYIINCLR